MASDDTIESLRAENNALKAQLGLNGDGTPSRELLFRDIARGLLLEDDAVRAVIKYGHEDSAVRITLQVNGETRHLDCPAKKLVRVTYVKELIADVCDRVLEYRQGQWTKLANLILNAAEKAPGYERDTETIEWIAMFANRACASANGASYANPHSTSAELFARIIAHQTRRAGIQEASHTGELFFIRRADDGIILGQADFIGFVWIHQSHRLTRADLTQRLSSLGFHKAPVFARQDEQTAKLKACWHSPASWLTDHDVDLPVFHNARRDRSGPRRVVDGEA